MSEVVKMESPTLQRIISGRSPAYAKAIEHVITAPQWGELDEDKADEYHIVKWIALRELLEAKLHRWDNEKAMRDALFATVDEVLEELDNVSK